MKHALTLAAAGLLLASTAAYAQHDDRHDRGRDNHQQSEQHGARGEHQQQRGMHTTTQSPAAKPTMSRGTSHPTMHHGPTGAPGTNRGPERERGHDSHSHATPGHAAPGHVAPGHVAPGRRDFRGDRHDLSRYRGNVHARHRYHARRAWHAPHGYKYRRFSYGQRLPRAYYVQSYWLSNFLLYGLMPPPPDYVWVRVGPDALLVDRDTGEVIRAEYNVFY